MMCSYSESQRDALILKFILQSILHVSDKSTVHHQEYLNTAIVVRMELKFHPDHDSRRQQN